MHREAAHNRCWDLAIACLALAGAVIAVSAAGVTKCDSPPRVCDAGVVAALVFDGGSDPEIAPPAAILAVRRFPHDKRQPRPPRQRGERASSYVSDLEHTASLIDSIIHADLYRPLLAGLPTVSPLSGHPLELLRPPSVRA